MLGVGCRWGIGLDNQFFSMYKVHKILLNEIITIDLRILVA